MPSDFRNAHRANDSAVCEAYGWRDDIGEDEIVARLFVLYHELIQDVSLPKPSTQNIIL